MPKACIDQYYYRNGQLRMITRHADGKILGVSRAWHYNGQLAQETRYRNGKLHGTSCQWDPRGKLLGSFTMNRGTGTMRHWFDDGRLCSDTDLLNGKFHGRMRTWLRDGKLVEEAFCIGNSNVSRAAYLKAAKDHPDWPQYEGQAAGRVARETTALECKKL